MSPTSNQDRRAALRRAGLGEAPDKALDRITELVCSSLSVPVALISLVDGHRQFFACAQGLSEPWATRLETPLSHSFCKHVVSDAAPVVVNDSRVDQRLGGNLAISELDVIAYLGVPLLAPEGHVLGTLCAVDSRPRVWRDEDTQTMTTLAGVFTDHIVLRNRTVELEQTAEALARLQVFSDRSPAAQIIVDVDGRVLSVNSTACERLGYTAEELATLHLGDIQPDATSEMVRHLLEEARSQNVEPFESQHRAKDGRTFPVEISVAATSSGEIHYLAITASDITERKRRVADLAARESRLRFALDAGAMGAWDWDVRGGRVLISDRQAQLLGLPAGCVELDPAQALEFVHAGDRSRVRADVQLAIESGRDFEVECRIVRADGEERWMLSRGQMMRDAVNKPTRLLGVMLDITQRRATYEELRLRDERIRSLLDATAEGIYGLDMEGRCTFANESCARLLGYDSADQLLGHNMHTLIHHHRPDGNVYPMEECRIFATFQKNEGVHVDDEVFFRRDGTAFPVEYWSHPVTRDGELVGSVVTFLDISERLDAQHRIVESEVFLRSSINSLGTHLAILDSDARIIRTNRAWDEFGARNGANADRIGEQANYLEVCAAAGDDEVATSVRRALEELLAGDRQEFAIEYPCHSPEEQRWFLLRLTRFETPSGTYAVSAHDDITARKLTEHRLERRTEILSRLNEVNRSLAAELDLEQLVDRVTQVTTRLCGAEFGAFFYNVERRGDPSYMLYAIAGADRAEFEQFPMPRATDIFGPTFRGEGVIRLDDVTADPRYGRNAPFAGMPAKHLPVRSYLAVPVITRSGEVLGGLFFGHSDAGVFSETSESLVVGVAGQAAVAIDNARLYRDVERREEEYRGTFENAAVGIVHVDLDGSVLRVNDRLGEITGRDPGTLPGTPLVDLIEADDGELVATLLREVAGGSVHKSNDELRYRHAGGEAVWAMQTASLVRDDEGGSSYVVLIVQDISDRKQAEEHQNLLVRELSHRVKNLLATVASISSQTLRQATDLDEFADSFQGRLSALANVHTLLVQTEWKGASLQLIVDRNFAPYAEDHEDSLRTRGVDVFLNPRAALAISLVLHELTTNAIKYGALSDRAGAIDLAWELTDQANEQSLVIQWRERGGPPVTPPSTTGFGSTLIQKGIEFELDGDVRFEYRPEGIACRLQVPAASFMGE